MKKQQCKICNEMIELEEDDSIRICYVIGHVTQKQWENKQRKLNEKAE